MADIYRRVLRLPVYVLAPVLAGLACVAEPLVSVLLGAKWLGCVALSWAERDETFGEVLGLARGRKN